PTAYLNPQDRPPPPPKPSGETAKRAADAREVPHQNFWSSLTRAVGAFFRWVTGLTEADDGADRPPSEEASTPSSPGSRIDRFV
ncbi:MAG: hypothetical protein KJ621_00300, partial [Proteobacteria bacterium]|nr:hypothetical protein [Pseudomonadota bacterium]